MSNKTTLISIRVPEELLEKIDAEALKTPRYTRSSIILNLLSAVYNTTDDFTRYLMVTWQFRKKGHYKLSFDFVPNAQTEKHLSTANLITP